MRYLTILAVMVAMGCATVKNEASVSPDGTKVLTQTIHVTSGAKLDQSALNFTAESESADGANWKVTSGAGAAGVQTPDIMKEANNLVRTGGELALGYAGIQAQRPEKPGILELMLADPEATAAAIRELRRTDPGRAEALRLLLSGAIP